MPAAEPVTATRGRLAESRFCGSGLTVSRLVGEAVGTEAAGSLTAVPFAAESSARVSGAKSLRSAAIGSGAAAERFSRATVGHAGMAAIGLSWTAVTGPGAVVIAHKSARAAGRGLRPSGGVGRAAEGLLARALGLRGIAVSESASEVIFGSAAERALIRAAKGPGRAAVYVAVAVPVESAAVHGEGLMVVVAEAGKLAAAVSAPT